MHNYVKIKIVIVLINVLVYLSWQMCTIFVIIITNKIVYLLVYSY